MRVALEWGAGRQAGCAAAAGHRWLGALALWHTLLLASSVTASGRMAHNVVVQDSKAEQVEGPAGRVTAPAGRARAQLCGPSP